MIEGNLKNKKEIIRTIELSKTFLKDSMSIEVLKKINILVKKGAFFAIMGPSGAGKSTLLYILGCLDRPSSGMYIFSGKKVSNFMDHELSFIRSTQIGFVFQTFNLLHQYTVLENVKIPFLYNDTKEKAGHYLALDAIKKVNLTDRMDHYPSELSGGELQRTAIARALAIDPSLLLADEPTGNLDSRTGEEIISIFHQLNERGMTILMVTHNHEVANKAHRKLIIRDGSLMDRG